MSQRTPQRTRLLSLAVLLLATSCTALYSPDVPSGYFFAAGWGSGGPAPFGQSLFVYSDGRVIFQGSGLFRATANPRLLHELRSLLAAPQTTEALRNAEQSDLGLTEEAGVWLLVNGTTFEFACHSDSHVLKLFLEPTNALARPFGQYVIPPGCI